MYFMSIFEEVASCRVLKAHLEMFITQHVTYHRRLSQESKKPFQDTTTDVINMNNHNHEQPMGNHPYNHHHNQQQLPNNQPIELMFNPQHPENPPQNIDEDMIHLIANRIKEIGDRLEKDKKYQRKMRLVQTVVPATVICGAAAFAIYRSVKQ